jgi:hypothetical protein
MTSAAHGLLREEARLEAPSKRFTDSPHGVRPGRAKFEKPKRRSLAQRDVPRTLRIGPLTPNRREIAKRNPPLAPVLSPEAKAELLPAFASGEGPLCQSQRGFEWR